MVIVYPTPTVWSTHTLMALDEKGGTLLNLLKTPAVQKLAWERHGFRAANFAGTDSISRFGVPGTLDQIPAVSELCPTTTPCNNSSPPSNPRNSSFASPQSVFLLTPSDELSRIANSPVGCLQTKASESEQIRNRL